MRTDSAYDYKLLAEALIRLGLCLGYQVTDNALIDMEDENPDIGQVFWSNNELSQSPIMYFAMANMNRNVSEHNESAEFSACDKYAGTVRFSFHISIDARKRKTINSINEDATKKCRLSKYAFGSDGHNLLITDILAQHRLVCDKIDVIKFTESVKAGFFERCDFGIVMSKIWSLKFAEINRFVIHTYAYLSLRYIDVERLYLQYLRERENRLESNLLMRCSKNVIGNEFDDVCEDCAELCQGDNYKTFIGENFAYPLHLGIMSFRATEEMRKKYAQKLISMDCDCPSSTSTYFGRCAECDSFFRNEVIGYWVVVAALMREYQNVLDYISDVLLNLSKELKGISSTASLFASIWAVHVSVAGGKEGMLFDTARNSINCHGGTNEVLLYNPPSFGYDFIKNSKLIDKVEIQVPSFDEFAKEIKSRYEKYEHRERMALGIAICTLVENEPARYWSNTALKILHG